MKNIIFYISIIVSFFLLQSNTTLPGAEVESIEVKSSKIVWKGYKLAGSHEGTLNLLSGSLEFNDDVLSGGEFVIDMASLISTDLSGEYKGKLEGHLKSDDFFGVDTYPTSSLKITGTEQVSKNAYTITADLTIKGITQSINFDASVYGKKATANLKVDRTKFGVKYGSGSFFEGLKDNLIYDEFDLVIDIEM